MRETGWRYHVNTLHSLYLQRTLANAIYSATPWIRSPSGHKYLTVLTRIDPVRGPAAPYRPDRLEETRYCWPLLPAQGASCQPARVMGANPRQAEAGETSFLNILQDDIGATTSAELPACMKDRKDWNLRREARLRPPWWWWWWWCINGMALLTGLDQIRGLVSSQ